MLIRGRQSDGKVSDEAIVVVLSVSPNGLHATVLNGFGFPFLSTNKVRTLSSRMFVVKGQNKMFVRVMEKIDNLYYRKRRIIPIKQTQIGSCRHSPE